MNNDEVGDDDNKSINSKFLNILAGIIASSIFGYVSLQTMLTTACVPDE